VDFRYEIYGVGWARARIRDGASEVRLRASYLGDALGDLLETLVYLLWGAEIAQCSWEEEPGEYRWIFRRSGSEVNLVILALPDNFPRLPDDAGTQIYETNKPLVEVVTAIADGAQRVLDEHGEAGYLAQWLDAPFPTDHLHLIRTLLAERL